MATNLKGKGRFVSLLLLHGEKIAIGIVGLVALWFVYRSLKVDKLDDEFQADKLQNGNHPDQQRDQGIQLG